jgi:hypothetical protein
MVEQREAQKARGRNRITGNLSARSRPLAPPQHHPRIAIAGDIPPGSCKSSGRQIDYTKAGAASTCRGTGSALAEMSVRCTQSGVGDEKRGAATSAGRRRGGCALRLGASRYPTIERAKLQRPRSER